MKPWMIAVAFMAMIGFGYAENRVELDVIQVGDSLGAVVDWQVPPPESAVPTGYNVRIIREAAGIIESSYVTHPTTIDTIWIAAPAPGDTLVFYAAVASVDATGSESVAEVSNTISREGPTLPLLPPASVTLDTTGGVLPPDTVIPPPDTVIPSPSEDVVFSSDWGTALGSSDAALLDGSWNQLLNNGNSLAVISSAGLDFPSTNVLRITTSARGGSNAGAYSANIRLLANSNVIPVPAVGESLYYRWYIRVGVPDSYTADQLTHPIQDGTSGGSDNWQFEIVTAANGRWTPRFYTGTGGTAWPDYRWTAPSLAKNQTYRFEMHLYRNGSNTFQIHPRVYDSADRLLYDDDDFNNANSTARLSSNPSFGFNDPRILRGWQVGLNGFSAGSSFGWVYSYQGATCVRTDTWCGAYR